MSDWIKLRTNLHHDFDVLKITRILSDICPTNVWEVVGRLSEFWGWIGSHSADGHDIPLTHAEIDAHISRPGFAAALAAVGWLSGRDGALEVPKWERHNGASAKARALESEAKRLRRGLSDNMSDKCPTKKGRNVRPDKRREEKKGTHTPPAPAPPVEGGPTEEQVIEAFRAVSGLPEWASKWWGENEATGWVLKGQPIRDWRKLVPATVATYRANHHRNGQKPAARYTPEAAARGHRLATMTEAEKMTLPLSDE